MAHSVSPGSKPPTELIPNIIDHYAQIKPDAIYVEYPISPVGYEKGYRPVTYKDLANAINGTAKWLKEKLGGTGNGEILAYVGPNDLRYPALVLGAIKAGYCMFLTSPRNSAIAHQSLLKRLNCKTLITSSPRPPPANIILEAYPLNVLEAPGLDELLDIQYPHFPFSKTWPEASKETLLVLHTSGSTGIPKPIFWSHDTAWKSMASLLLSPPEGYESLDEWNMNKRMYLVPPPFHAAGVAYLHVIGLTLGITIIAPAGGGLPSAAALVEARKQTPFETALVVPSIIQELAQSPDLLDYVSQHMTHLVYCGGDLPQPIGDTVAAKIKLVNQYGATEVGMMPLIYSTSNRDPLKDWRWLDLHPKEGAELRHVSGDEYELVIARNSEFENHQIVFTIFEQPEYHTSDLFVRHPDPSKSDLWRWSARADDVIVFLNGEKTNPISMEQHIVASNPEVTSVLVAGARRFQASLIVQLNTGKDLCLDERAVVIERIWPSIQEANAVCPAHARIAKTHILFTTQEKPILLTAKGTIQRAGTLAQYHQELEDLYADADKLSGQAASFDERGSSSDPGVLSTYIRESLLEITGWTDGLSDTENWLSRGLDSLQIITATRIFRQGLNLPDLSPSMIYLHSTVTDLTEAVLRLRQEGEQSSEAYNRAHLQEREDLLRDLVRQIDVSSSTKTHDGNGNTEHTVILTGSTGNLGTFILDALTKNDSVRHVYCLNRKEDASEVQAQKSAAYSLNIDTSRVSFWTADLSNPDFSLQPEAFQHLQDNTTLIIHNAWAVNFNLSLSSFKPNLDSVVNLINFTGLAKHSASLYFISSIGSTIGYSTENGLTPEKLINMTTPSPNGYTNSKYIAEHLLAEAAQNIDTAFARVGQVAGPVRAPGIWNKTEWFPSLVLSSLHVGALPKTLGTTLGHIDWVPIDLLAEVLVELALSSEPEVQSGGKPSTGVKVHHPVNLNSLGWDDIRPAVASALHKATGKTIETIASHEWLLRVRRDIETAGSGRDKAIGEKELQELLARNPAAKLLEFFGQIMPETANEVEAWNVLDTRLTAQRSEKLQAVGAVQSEWIDKWVREWLQ
ncbi:NRPS-like enzyme [Penicillium angulare]|uniref:NRPS-like enzyme n=1 Tax=Penicillium angulare TaxID=116970 RepID=A0A9W9JWA9_9EURO|nr:NRPS-like enzyme [Penicillium angulare]